MTKKNSNIESLLNRPHLQARNSSNNPPPDPLITTRVHVTLDQLVPYAGNPRKTQNPNYDDIKESIRNRGLDHAPNITRENPSDPYMIKDGGNTRLKILKELWKETRDRRYYELDCMFHPWTDDLDILVGHMVENEARGSMLFIERAIAAARIRDLLTKFEGGKSLSTSELSRRITAIGWKLENSTLNQLLYAHDTLHPFTPNAFWGGMGRDTVKKIRKLLDSGRKYWEIVANPDEGDFDDVWKVVFSLLDEESSEGFDLEDAEYKLSAELAERLDAPLNIVRAQLQTVIEGLNLTLERPTHATTAFTSQPVPTPPPAIVKSQVSTPKETHTESPERYLQPTNDNNTSTFAQEKNTSSEPSAKQGTTQPIITGVTQTEHPSVASSQDPLQPSSAAPPISVMDWDQAELGSPSSFKYLLELTREELQALAGDTATAYAQKHNFDFCVVTALQANFTGQEGWHSGFIVRPASNKEERDYICEDFGRAIHYQHLYQLSIALRSFNLPVPPEWATTPHPLEQEGQQFTDYLSNRAPAIRPLILGLHLDNDDPEAPHSESFHMLTELEAIIGVLMTRMSKDTGRLW